MNITPEQLAETVVRELTKYNQDVTDMLHKEIKSVAKETAKELRGSSPRKTGEYAKHWATKVVYENREDIRVAVYNKKPTYRLTHLLERGHAKVGGGRVSAQPHIAKAEKNAIRKIGNKIKVGVRQCG